MAEKGDDMRPELLAAMVLLALPGTAQRGVVERVIVSPDPVLVGAKVSITVRGTNPCGAVNIDYGDGSESITHPLTEVPATIEHRYSRPGDYRVRARGMGNCDGDATTTLRVLQPEAERPSSMRFQEMDADGDGVITRREWRGNEQSFRANDRNGDGVLSGDEVDARRNRQGLGLARTAEEFNRLDSNRNGVITPNEWPRAEGAFERLDTDNDGVITRDEFTSRNRGDRQDADTVVVEASRAWTGTGVYVRRGEMIRVVANGTVQLSTDGRDTADPGGSVSGRRAPSAPLRNRVAGALIARVGDSEPIFVGAAQSFRAPRDGEVFLGVNDDHFGDNRGEFRVRITTGR